MLTPWLANERTALGWIRTAQAFAMMGVIIAQLMRLYRSPSPDPVFGFFVVSVPLSLLCHVMAMVITILGCCRYLHWQSEMARGNAISSGWELIVIFVLTILVCLASGLTLPNLTDSRIGIALRLHYCCCHQRSRR